MSIDTPAKANLEIRISISHKPKFENCTFTINHDDFFSCQPLSPLCKLAYQKWEWCQFKTLWATRASEFVLVNDTKVSMADKRKRRCYFQFSEMIKIRDCEMISVVGARLGLAACNTVTVTGSQLSDLSRISETAPIYVDVQ